jgi:hypothetical protein
MAASFGQGKISDLEVEWGVSHPSIIPEKLRL